MTTHTLCPRHLLLTAAAMLALGIADLLALTERALAQDTVHWTGTLELVRDIPASSAVGDSGCSPEAQVRG